MHRDRQADPAATDQRNTQFFLSHRAFIASSRRRDQWVVMRCLMMSAWV
jgi:hypothetical protein